MIDLPAELAKRYEIKLTKREVPDSYRNFYKKWLRFYWDFCHKYGFRASDPQSLTPFIEKLKAMKQSQAFQRQAYHAVILYHELLNEQGKTTPVPAPPQNQATTGC